MLIFLTLLAHESNHLTIFTIIDPLGTHECFKSITLTINKHLFDAPN